MTSFSEILRSDSVYRLGWTLVHSLWQIGLLASVLALLLALLRRRSANLCYLTACAGLAAMFAVPLATWGILPDRPSPEAAALSTPPESPRPVPVDTVLPNAELPNAELPSAALPSAAGPEVAPSTSSPANASAVAAAQPLRSLRAATPLRKQISRALSPWVPWLVMAWFIGVLSLSVWHLGGWIAMQRLKQLGTALGTRQWARQLADLKQRMRLGRPVRMLRSTMVDVPAVIGWLRPVVLVPAAVLGQMSPQQIDAVLAHELAHIRRYDYLVNLLQTVVETLLFYHPAVWWLSRRIRIEREHCCDDAAIAVCGSKVDYAEALTAVEQARTAPGLAMAATGAGGPGSALRRVRRVLGLSAGDSPQSPRYQSPRYQSRSWLGGSVAVLLLAAMTVTCMAWAREKDPARPLAPGVEADVKLLKAKIRKIESLCAPAKGTLRHAVQNRFGKGDPGRNAKAPRERGDPGSRYWLYEFCENGSLLICYDAESLDVVVWARYLDPYSAKGRAKPPTPEERLRELQQRLKQMQLILAEYKRRFGEDYKIAWGKAVEGVQVRVRADMAAWPTGADPSFQVDIRSRGKREPFIGYPQSFQVEVDGKRHTANFWASGWPRSVEPGGQLSYALSLGDFLSSQTGDRLTGLRRGKHTIRVVLSDAGFREEGSRGEKGAIRFGHNEFEAVSNPVEIEVIADEPAAGGEKVISSAEPSGARQDVLLRGADPSCRDFWLDVEDDTKIEQIGGATSSRCLREAKGRGSDVTWKLIETRRGHMIQAQSGRFAGWYLDYDDDAKIGEMGGATSSRNLLLTKEKVPGAYWKLTKTDQGHLIQAQEGRFTGWYLDLDLLTKEKVEGAFWEIAPRRIDTAAPWGPATEGVQCRLLPKKSTWKAGRVPQIQADLRNRGQREFSTGLAPESREVQYDGVWYRTTARFSGAVELLRLEPGSQRNGISLLLEQRWRWRSKDGDQPLVFKPGKHTMRAAFKLKGGSVRVVSHPIKIEILSDQPAGSGGTESLKPAIVELVLDKTAYFLGENVLLHYGVTNRGEAPFEVGFGGDSRGSPRALRFKVIATDENGRPVEDPYPSVMNMGGEGGERTLKPGEAFWASLPLMRYCDFDKPGVYKIRVYHDLGWEKAGPGEEWKNLMTNALPKGPHRAPIVETTIKIVLPTREQARRVVAQMLALPKDANASFGKQTRPYQDVTTLRHPVYLPIVEELARKGSQPAATAVGAIPTPEATRALIRLLDCQDRDVAAKSLELLLRRLPLSDLDDQAFGANQQRLARRSWRDELQPAVVEVGWKLMAKKDRASLIKAARILECLGRPGDFPRFMKELDRVLEEMKDDPTEQNAYPRPANASGSMIRAGWQLIERGAAVPTDPQTPGQAALFALALGRRADFRPADWQATAGQLLRHPIPYVRSVTLENLRNVPLGPLHGAILPLLKDDHLAVSIPACDLAATTKAKQYREPLLEVLRAAEDQWLMQAAHRAALACGAGRDRVLEICIDQLGQPRGADSRLYPWILALMIEVVEREGGYGHSQTDWSTAGELAARWRNLLKANREQIRAGKLLKIGQPPLTPDLFPRGFQFQRKDHPPWPDWSSIPAESETVPDQPAAGGEETAWGPALQGVQCRLEPDKPTWKTTEAPTLKAYVRHQTETRLFLANHPEFGARLEVDGHWHRWSGPFEWTGPAHSGSKFRTKDEQPLKITLDDNWKQVDNKQPLRLDPGRHVIRFAWEGFSERGPREGPDEQREIVLASNPAEITILPDSPPPKLADVHPDEKQAAAALQQLGAILAADDQGRIRSVRLSRTAVTDAGLVHLGNLAELKAVYLDDTQITDAGLRHVAELAGLKTLSVNYTRVGDAALEHLKGLGQLGSFELLETDVTAAGLRKLEKALPQMQTTVDPLKLAGLAELRGWRNSAKLGDDYELISVDLLGPKVADDWLQRLKNRKSLQDVCLYRAKITDAGLAHLRGLTELHTLYLSGTRITDAGLEHVKEMKKLKKLFLADTQIGDAGLAHLEGLTELELLWINGTRASDAGMVHLEPLTNLTQLKLNNCQVGGAGLSHLRGLRKLTTLELNGTAVADAGLVHLEPLVNLELLYLSHTSVTDAGLEHVTGLQKLRMLEIEHAHVTDQGIKQLQLSLPKTGFYH